MGAPINIMRTSFLAKYNSNRRRHLDSEIHWPPKWCLYSQSSASDLQSEWSLYLQGSVGGVRWAVATGSQL